MMTQITEETFEQVLQHLLNSPTIIGLKDAAFIDPYGIGILEIGELLKSKGIRKTIQLPKSEEVLKYLERMDFFRFAGDPFDLELSNSPAPPLCKSGESVNSSFEKQGVSGVFRAKIFTKQLLRRPP